jgi:cystathionine gamma-synthase
MQKHGREGEKAMLFPSIGTARRCLGFVKARDLTVQASQLRTINLVLDPGRNTTEALRKFRLSVAVVFFPEDSFHVAKEYWQHSGDGISSRYAEFCHGLFQEGLLVDEAALKPIENGEQRFCKGPKRYQRGSSIDKTPWTPESHDSKPGIPAQKPVINGNAENRESSQFVEERFGRNLDVLFVDNAKSAIRRRIAGSLIGDVDLTTPLSAKMEKSIRGVANLTEEDVYLYPCGMNSIFNVHQALLETHGPMKSIMFGFPYVDTYKILEKFGPGCLFYGHGSAEELDDLEQRLKRGERYLALFCEFPGNPLLKSPDLKRIKAMGEKYDFAVVVDETIGNFINVHVLPYSDIVVSSLTKVFTGECNVMGGSAILNPCGQYYKALKDVSVKRYENNYWAEDVIVMERNSRDFVSRIERINRNAEAICDILGTHTAVKAVYYPKVVSSRPYYDACRTENGGYGGLLSVTFHTKEQAVAFFDHIQTAKGPSLGTNFTLVSPYVVLAHYSELEWAASFGVEPDLIRISVGLEETQELRTIFLKALKAAENCGKVL